MAFNRGEPVADLGMSISQTNAAAAYGRTEFLGASIPVRPTDPIRPRFQVKDEVAADQAEDPPRTISAEGDEQAAAESSGSSRQSAAGFGSGLLGAFTSFLARFFGQGEAETTTSASSSSTAMQNGVAAYGRAAASGLDGAASTEVLSPSFPRLASGRALDLSV